MNYVFLEEQERKLFASGKIDTLGTTPMCDILFESCIEAIEKNDTELARKVFSEPSFGKVINDVFHYYPDYEALPSTRSNEYAQYSLLHLSVAKDRPEIARMLCLHPDIYVNQEGVWPLSQCQYLRTTPLHMACYRGCSEEILDALMQKQSPKDLEKMIEFYKNTLSDPFSMVFYTGKLRQEQGIEPIRRSIKKAILTIKATPKCIVEAQTKQQHKPGIYQIRERNH